MANPSVSIDIETPSTVYTLPPPPKYSEIYQKSNPLPDFNNLPPLNPNFEQRQTRLIGPSQSNLARNPPTTRHTTSNVHQSHYESEAVTRHRRDIIVTRCCFSLPLLIIIIIYAIVRVVTDT
uniref:Uncharacterized protein n=1 Tax=Panagrolaimus sp. PS1159 TaxID=55785 RepID=A0AC35EWQ4_9BILA